jgi:hypothetical protein
LIAPVLRRERRLVTVPDSHRWWRSHAQCPTVLALHDSLWRVYFAARDANNKSRIIYADFDPSHDMQLIKLQTEPLLELGSPGAFDSAGMGPSVALFVGDRLFLYYIGISLRRDVPHQPAIGLAISEDGGSSFRRATPGPILSAGPFDPFFTSTPHVAYQGGAFRMHYMSGIAWDRHGDLFDARYLIKCARSTNGISWATEDRVVLGFAGIEETALARPWVINWNGDYHMWLCCRGPRRGDPPSEQPYRLGYAQSADGLAWRREDDLMRFENPPQADDWDAAMQAYPCIVPHRSELFGFYNGNGFGQTGFGFARVVMSA